MRQLLPTGGTVQFSAGDNYADYDAAPGFGGPTLHGHVPFLNLALAHPLLRGAGTDVTYANIYLAQRDYSISLAQFKRQVINICANVEEAYHNLVLTTATVRIQEQLLADTDATRKRVWDRKDIDVDAVQYNQSLSAVESRKAELILARSAQRSASDRLKSLINDRELDLRANTLLVPSDRPSTEAVTYNVAEVIDTALRQRTEVQEARLQIEKTDIIVKATASDLLPKLDLNAAVQSNGGYYENDVANAFYSTVNSARYIDYSAGLKFEMPFGNREAEARYQRRLLERRQALTGLLNTAQKVVVDVKLNLREVYKSYEEIGARESARVATARELNGLIKKENIVQLTPEFLRLKLDAQLRLALAEIAEIQAMVNYNIAISKLEQSKGTLLEYNHIAINTKPTETPMQKLWLIGQSIEWQNPFEANKTSTTAAPAAVTPK
jgi:outer membrane protein TolC